jgi:hypothetical protein
VSDKIPRAERLTDGIEVIDRNIVWVGIRDVHPRTRTSRWARQQPRWLKARYRRVKVIVGVVQWERELLALGGMEVTPRGPNAGDVEIRHGERVVKVRGLKSSTLEVWVALGIVVVVFWIRLIQAGKSASVDQGIFRKERRTIGTAAGTCHRELKS